MYIARKKKAGKERERERERESCCPCMSAGGHQIHSSRERNGFCWHLLYLCQKQLSSFELIQFIARECKPSWREEARIFPDPLSSFKSVFFLQIFIQKVVLPHYTNAFYYCLPLLLANVFSALSKHLFPSSFHCSFQARESFEEGRAFLMSSSVSFE